MRTLILFVSAFALVAMVATIGQAALLVEYDFEGNGTATAGLPVTTPAATIGSAGFVTTGGMIGSGAASVMSTTGAAININVPHGNDPWPQNSDNGLWTGSLSFWMNGATANTAGNIITCRNLGTGAINMGVGTGGSQTTSIFYTPGVPYTTANAVGPDLFTSTWHLVTATWTMTTGPSGTGSYDYYVDGSLVKHATGASTFSTATLTGTSTGLNVLGADSSGAIVTAGRSQIALFDNYAAWSNLLSAIEVASLFNLGNSTLNYGAANAQALFDLYATGGTAVIGGQTWTKVDSGLGTVAGAVIANSALNLGGADGSGVQIVPEPGTLSLLLASAIGLLVFARRKLK